MEISMSRRTPLLTSSLLLTGFLAACGEGVTYRYDSGTYAGGSSDFSDTANADDTTGNSGTADTSETDDGNGSTTGPEATDDGNATTSATPSFTREVLVEAPGAAWMKATDLNGDGYNELLLTSLTLGLGWQTWSDSSIYPPLAAGAGHILSRNGGAPTSGGVGTWTATEYFGDGDTVWFPNQSTVADVDNDGINDWIVAAGFLAAPYGQVIWFKGSTSGNGITFDTTIRNLEVPSYGDLMQWYHELVPVDIDGDGDTDFITTNHDSTPYDEGTSRVELWLNNGVEGTASFTHSLLATGYGGALFDTADLDDDGDLDIVFPQYFEDTSLVWLEQTGSNGSSWKAHTINNTTGRGFAAKIVDLDGDGNLDIVYNNHNHQASDVADEKVMGVYWFEVPAADVIHDLTNWNDYMTVVYEGFEVVATDPNSSGAPGVFDVHDVDGDGDQDIAMSGDGDEGLYLFIQNDGNVFEPITLSTGMQQAGSPVLFDIDLDGDQDIVWPVFGDWSSESALTEWTPDSAVYAFIQQ